jgi:hypothetical protein
VTVRDTVPTGLTHVAASGKGWSCTIGGQTVTCTDTDGLRVAERTTIILTVEVLAAAVPRVTNTVTVDSAAEDVQRSNNTSSDTVPVTQPDGGTPDGPGTPSRPGTPGGDSLPRTGAAVGGLVALALLLLTGGAALMAASRRRPS